MICIGKFKDLTHQKFGRLLVLEKTDMRDHRYIIYKCKCDCGNIIYVNGNKLRSGHTKSCGCYRKELLTSHGKSNTRLYNIYHHMKARCYNITHDRYKDYGARGIVVCDEWLTDFTAFYNWSIENGYRENLTIDRIDVNGNYEPNNCRWATPKEQQRNTRYNRNYTINGETHCLIEWCERLNRNYNTVACRINRGWPVEKALFTPIRGYRHGK